MKGKQSQDKETEDWDVVESREEHAFNIEDSVREEGRDEPGDQGDPKI